MIEMRVAIIFQAFAEQAIKGIRENIRNKRISKYGAAHASGTAENSLKYRLTENGFEIYVDGKAVDYFETLESGRKPGKRPPVAAIREWIDIKGIVVTGKMTKDSMAFIIAKRIGDKGSSVFQRGGKTGIITDYLNDKAVMDMQKKVIPAYVEAVSDQLFKVFYSIAA